MELFPKLAPPRYQAATWANPPRRSDDRNVEGREFARRPILKKLTADRLALYILMNELLLNATPFGPENIVVIMTGPLTGNGFTPGGTKMTAFYLSPLQRRPWGEARPAVIGEPT